MIAKYQYRDPGGESGNITGNAGYDNISVTVDIDSDPSPEALQELHEKVTSTSPAGHTLTRAAPVKINLA